MPCGWGSGGSARHLKRRMARALKVANDRFGHRDDDGVTLIECAVAVALLVIVILPTTLFMITTQKSLSQSHLEAEANTLASQAVAGLQAEASRDDLPNGFQSTAYAVDEVNGRKTLFTITTSWTTIQQGTNHSICAAGTGAGPTDQIWLATASVSWPDMDGAQPVSQTTEISPGDAGGLQQSAGELAVSLETTGAGSPPPSYTATSVTATVTGTWNSALGAQPAVPSGEYTSETESSINSTTGDFDGCLVFQNLDVAPGWNYVLSLAGNPGVVQAAEYSDTNPSGPFSEPVTMQAGVPDIVQVVLNQGTPVNVVPTQGPGGSCAGPASALTAPATTSEIPVTVNNSGLTMYTNNDWVAYNPTGATFNSFLLYPGYTTTTTLWYGDGPTSSQASPCSVIATGGPTLPATVYLQLYDLKMTVGGNTSVQLTATQVGGSGTVYDLHSGSTNQTDIPLGQYSIGEVGGGSVTNGASQAIVWVTEGGNCLSSASTPPSPCNSPISVTAS